MNLEELSLEELAGQTTKVTWEIRDNPPTDMECLAADLTLIRAIKKMWSDAEGVIETALAEAMGEQKQVIVGGVGVVEVKHSPKSPKWDHERLRPRLAALSRDERIVNEETGEIESDSDAALRVFMECAQVSYYRLEALRKRGLDPKEFREVEGWRTSIRITSPS